MHHHNHYYGHAHIMARYCGLDDTHPPRIRGYLQHGWNVADGFNPTHEFFDGATRFVWTPRITERGYALGRRNYYAIGAPWLYLLQTEPQPPAEPERTGTLWMLFHGWEGGKIEGDHERLISEIRETETEPVTLALYYTEYERPEVRASYEAAGFEVVCFGKRGFGYLGTDPKFHQRQLEAMRTRRRVCSNRLSSAIFYASSVGCEVAVYGDPMTMGGEDPRFGGQARLTREWPALIGKDLDQDVVRQITDHELGRRYLHPPRDIRALMFDGSID